jgi:hypothetical protein
MVQNKQKIKFSCFFLAIWAPPNGPKKERKKPQVGSCLSLEISPKPNHKAHCLKKNGPKQQEDGCFGVFWLVFFYHHFGAIWALPNEPNKKKKGPKEYMA